MERHERHGSPQRPGPSADRPGDVGGDGAANHAAAGGALDLETRIAERLALLKAERQRRFTELAQFDAVIAELEQLLQPPALPAEEPPVDAPVLASPNGVAEPA